MLNSSHCNMNQKVNHYLSTCDLINKYNLKTLYQTPTVKKIVCEVNFKDFLASAELSTLDQNNSISQIKSYLLLYILLGVLPYVNCNKNKKTLLQFAKNSENNYSLKFLFSTLTEKNHFFNSLFIENWTKLKLDGFSLFVDKNTLVNKKITSEFVFNSIIPGTSFIEVEDFFCSTINSLNLRNLKFNVNFLISNAKIKNKRNLVKNLPYFWISG
jgi:hypothetical protein